MLTRIRKLAMASVIIAFAAMAVFLTWALWFSQLYGEICHRDQKTSHENCATYHITTVVLWHIGEFLNYYAGSISAAATIFIAGFTFTLWKSTERQARLTRESINVGNREFAATHRPRVRIAYIKLAPLQPGQPATAEIWAINIGDSDAQITEIGADIFVRRIDMSGTATFSATLTPVTIASIAPGQQANISIRGGSPLRIEVIDGVRGSPNIDRAPWLHLCAVGTIHYLDANRTHRLTSFFRIYNPDRLRFMRATDDDEYAEWEYEA